MEEGTTGPKLLHWKLFLVGQAAIVIFLGDPQCHRDAQERFRRVVFLSNVPYPEPLAFTVLSLRDILYPTECQHTRDLS